MYSCSATIIDTWCTRVPYTLSVVIHGYVFLIFPLFLTAKNVTKNVSNVTKNVTVSELILLLTGKKTPNVDVCVCSLCLL